MGKSNNKSATKVAAPPVAVPKSGTKGKRGAENIIEKAVSAKKQKFERDEAVLAEQKTDKEQLNKASISSSEDDSDSDSGSEPKFVAKKTPIPAKYGSFVTKKFTVDTSSDSLSSSESNSDNDEKPVAKKQPAANGSAAVRKTPAADFSKTSESDDDDDDDDDNVAKVAHAAAPKGKVESSESDSDEEKDSSDSNEEIKANRPKGTPVPSVRLPKAKQAQIADDESSDDESSKAQPVKKVQASKKSDSSDESSDEDESSEEKAQTSLKKKDTDVEMADAGKSSASTFQETPKTPATPEAIVSKSLFVGNLTFSVKESDVREFFKNAGEVVEVRFSKYANGFFRGFGHVEFATVEAVQKAMELNDQELLGRPVRLDYACERSALTPKVRGLEAALQKNNSDLGGGFNLNVQEAKSRGDSAGGSGGRLDRGGKRGGRGGRDGGRFSGEGDRKGGRGGRSSGRGGRDGGKKKSFWDD